LDEVFYHEPVLLDEAIEYLLSSKDSTGSKVYVDCTLGGGGYTKKILDSTNRDIKVIAFDRDIFAIEHCKKVLAEYADRIIYIQANFGDIKEVLTGIDSSLKISGIVMDLGLSSYQLNHEEGFSYQRDTELDMRADKGQRLTAKDVFNRYDEKELAKILFEYGELRYSRKIAKEIYSRRKAKKFETTFDVVELLKEMVPVKYLNSDLSKLFQAVRIEVNNELGNLKRVLEDTVDFLETGARIVAISYHSLEDRIVKNSFRQNEILKVITKKPVEASEEEIERNTRARSAKLRAAEKIQI
jgi:16S rRNA (cytosine1402-N4)-methyltransferase